MTHVTCRLTARNRDQVRNPTLGNRVWATFTCYLILAGLISAQTNVSDEWRMPAAGNVNVVVRWFVAGLLSLIMRDLANLMHECPKWIVLDGDIDPKWIESLNTVMDDNKVLTLASNERISLTPSMRLLFEISHLKTATPATVSRAGILYINPGDLGWNP